jgi:hypothetical protein
MYIPVNQLGSTRDCLSIAMPLCVYILILIIHSMRLAVFFGVALLFINLKSNVRFPFKKSATARRARENYPDLLNSEIQKIKNGG